MALVVATLIEGRTMPAQNIGAPIRIPSSRSIRMWMSRIVTVSLTWSISRRTIDSMNDGFFFFWSSALIFLMSSASAPSMDASLALRSDSYIQPSRSSG